VAQEGSLAVLPAGVDAACDRSADTTSLLICIEPGRLALAAAEDSAFAAKLIDRMTGYDANLLHLGRLLIEECAADYSRGALFWNEAASRFISALVARHTTGPKPSDGVLDAAMLGRLREYLAAHLDEPIDVATLAHMTKRPYRYVVYLRLRPSPQRVEIDMISAPVTVRCQNGLRFSRLAPLAMLLGKRAATRPAGLLARSPERRVGADPPPPARSTRDARPATATSPSARGRSRDRRRDRIGWLDGAFLTHCRLRR
jgi:hypothetical protein